MKNKKKIRIAALASILSAALVTSTLITPVIAADDNSKEDIPIDISIPIEMNLHFNKIILGKNEALNLNENENYNFYITLENQKTGEIINGLLNNKEGFTIKITDAGTYIIRELDNMWFALSDITLRESLDGIELKEENDNYTITIDSSADGITANIDIINKTDEERYYNSKYDVKNLFFGF